MIIHPRFSQLNRFSDDDLCGSARARVASHLAACTRCRRIVQSIREISEHAPNVLLEKPDPGLLDKIVERRSRGDRVILPIADPQPPSVPGWQVVGVAATAMVIVLTVFIVVLTIEPLRADHSALRFAPDKPVRGSVIQAEYRPAGLLAAELQLVLRVRFRRPNDLSYNRTMKQVDACVLQRVRGALYTCEFVLPDSVVFAAFAVEQESGQRVDSNNGRLWDLMVYQGDKPEFEALEQRRSDHMGRDPAVVVQTIREAYRQYPDSIEALSNLNFALFLDRSQPGFDSVQAVYDEGFWSAHRKYSRSTQVDGNVLGFMYWCALRAEVDSVSDYWTERLMREAPHNPFAVQDRTFDVKRRLRDDHVAMMQEYELLWDEVGTVHASVAELGWYQARRAHDDSAMVVWAPRFLHAQPWAVESQAYSFLERPALREQGLAQLRTFLNAMDTTSDERRALGSTVDEQAHLDAVRRRRIYGRMGKALVEMGRVEAGMDTLHLAEARGWDPETFGIVADLRLGIADTLGAAEMYARVAIDPATDSTANAGVNALALSYVDAEQWQTLLMRAHDEMRRRVLPETMNQPANRRMRLVDDHGSIRELREILAGRIALLIGFYSDCPWCAPGVQSIARAHAGLTSDGVAMFAVLSVDSTKTVRSMFEEHGLSMPIYLDRWDELRVGLDVWATPTYTTLDGAGRVRYGGANALEALRVAQVLVRTRATHTVAVVAPS